MALFLLPVAAFCQQTVHGTIKDNEGKPLPGITVSLKGKNSATKTGSSGHFRLAAATGDVLVVSAVNYEAQEMKVDGRSEYAIVLKTKVTDMDDVIVIGYGTTTKSDVTGAVSKAPTASMQKAPVRSFDEALAGRVAGVTVSSVDGQPGSAVNIVIRGNNSITQDNSPLYVVDGFPIESPNNNVINPQDIESMDILKDASATAIYGARGANGVIIITTKKGKTGPPAISFNTSYGLQHTIKRMKLMDPYEFVKYQLEKDYGESAKTYLTNGKTLESYRDEPEIDWQNKMFRTAAMKNYSMSVSGGNAYTKYYLSGNIFNQDGIIINSGYNRYQGTISLDQTLSQKVRAGVYVNYSYLKQTGLQPSGVSNQNSTTGTLFSVWGYRNFAISGVPDLEEVLFDPGVDPTVDSRMNPVLNQQHALRENLSTNTIINAYAEYTVIPDLKLKITAGITSNLTQMNQFNDTFTVYGNKNSRIGSTKGINGSVIFLKSNTWMNENTLTYNKKLHTHHNLTIVAGYSQTGNKMSRYGASATNLPNASLGLSGLNEGTPETVTAISSSWGLTSFLGRMDYRFRSTYLLTLSYRADGSSKFREGNRWAYFPSGALAWRFGQEKFIKKFNYISDGKLRISYGLTGNNRIGDFSYLSSIAVATNSQGYTFGNATSPGAFASNFGNAGLKWETTAQLNLGADISFLKNRINLTADVYSKKTTDLLLYANLPLSLGYASALRNIGSVKNEGLELTLSTTNINHKKFTWKSNINITFNKSKILALTENQASITSTAPFDFYFSTIPSYISMVGNQLGTMYGYIWEGVYQYEDFNKTTNGNYILKDNVPSNGNLRSAIQPGDIRFRDINGDLTVDAKDYTIIGRGLPIHTGGFNNDFSYGQFDLNIFFQWSYGNDIVNANRYIFEGNLFGRSNLNQFASYENRWSPTNTSSTLYRVGGGGPTTPTGANSRVIEDGSYLRLKTVALGYSLPPNLLKRVKVRSCRVYVSAQNLVTWTKYSGIDPEVSVFNSVLTPGFDYSAYPRPRVVNVGINVNL
jgi:TonB-linked SusC/RagA family outer membrane protein